MGSTRKSAPKAGKKAKAAPSPLQADIAEAARHGYAFYVYTLSDADGVFYIGKGTRNRVFQHERLSAEDSNYRKKIRIRAAGGALQRSIVAFFSDEQAAYGLEASLIAEGAGLTNIAAGVPLSPKERAMERAREILSRIVPFEQSMARHKCVYLPDLGIYSARQMYDGLVAGLQRECSDPTPTSIRIGKDGRLSYGYGERHGSPLPDRFRGI